jgi:hypothetical protein
MKNVIAAITGAIVVISMFFCWHEHRLQKIEDTLYSAPEPPTDLPKPPHPIVPTMPQGWVPVPSKEALIKYLEAEADKKMVDEEITRINETIAYIKDRLDRHDVSIGASRGLHQVSGERYIKMQESIDALKDMDNRLFEGFQDLHAEMPAIKSDIIDLKKAVKE